MTSCWRRGRGVRYVAVGRTDGGARFIVIFLHGGGNGSRFQAVDDWSFGGNFNRLKNLVTRNDGVYLSPDFSGFGDQGKDDIKALMKTYAAKSPGAPIIVACTSLSGELCFDLMADRESASLLGGILLLGAVVEETASSRRRFSPIPLATSRSSSVTAARTRSSTG